MRVSISHIRALLKRYVEITGRSGMIDVIIRDHEDEHLCRICTRGVLYKVSSGFECDTDV